MLARGESRGQCGKTVSQSAATDFAAARRGFNRRPVGHEVSLDASPILWYFSSTFVRHLVPLAPEQPHPGANTPIPPNRTPERGGVNAASIPRDVAVFATHLATCCQIVAVSCRFCYPEHQTSSCC